MSKLNDTRKAAQRTLIGIAIVGISVYLGFTPLFEMVNGGVTGAVIGSSFGAIFVIILTMYRKRHKIGHLIRAGYLGDFPLF